jgi:hypothetical protein
MKRSPQERAALVIEKRRERQHIRDAQNREMSRNKAAAGVTHIHGRVDAAVAAARLAEIPPDTRSLTQRICGDPLPGRDALSRRAGQ